MLRRPLLLMTVLFTAGIYASVWRTDIFLIILVSVILFGAGAVFYKDKKWLCLGISLFLVLGFGRMELAKKHKDTLSATYGGSTFKGSLLVTDFSDGGCAEAVFEDNGIKRKIYLNTNSDSMLCPGDILEGSFIISEYSPTKTGLFDYAAYMHSEGIFLSARAESFYVKGQMTEGIEGMIYRVRTYMNRVGEKAFQGDSRALFNAMVFGDKRLLSPGLDKALRSSGLSHIAVVSGMHISAVIMAIVFFLGKIFGKKRYVNICVLFGAVFIALITGMGASVIRALIMCIVYHLSKILYRDSDIYTTIAASALLMLTVSPYFVANVGFVLSLLCVLGIVLYTDKISKAIKGILPKWAGNAVAVSLAAQLLVLPILIMDFKAVNPYSIISNILIFPVSSLFVVLGLIYFFTVQIPFVSDLLRVLLQFISDVIEAVSLGVSKVPGAEMKTSGLSAFFAANWIFILIMIHLHPVKISNLKRLCSFYLATMCVIVITGHGVKMELRFAHYGASTFSAIKLREGGAIFIDCPDYSDAVTCREDFDEDIKCLIISSLPEGDIFPLFQSKLPQTVIASDDLLIKEEKLALKKDAENAGIRTVFLKDGERISVGGAWIEYFSIDGARGRAVRIEYEDLVFVSLQGIAAKDTGKLFNLSSKIKCDYLKIPYRITRKGADFSALTDGRILTREKHLVIR